MRRFVEEARAQSLGRAGLDTTEEDLDLDLDEEDPAELTEEKGLPIIDGRPVNLAAKPRQVRNWDLLVSGTRLTVISFQLKPIWRSRAVQLGFVSKETSLACL